MLRHDKHTITYSQHEQTISKTAKTLGNLSTLKKLVITSFYYYNILVTNYSKFIAPVNKGISENQAVE